MSVFMSFYTMVVGLFVSNLIGTNALSAINLVYPVIALVTAISTMLATGGSAVIMKKMGEGKPDEAKQDFTFLILVNVLAGLVMCGIGYLFTGKMFNAMSPVSYTHLKCGGAVGLLSCRMGNFFMDDVPH